MSVLARSPLTAGLAAISAAALIAVPAVTPTAPVAHQDVPVASAPAITPQFRDIVLAARTEALTTLAAAPTVSSAGSAIVNAWYAVVPWITYGVDLADYVLGFIPFGSAVADQINIFYDSLLPIADSFVVDLVAPVVDQPLNLGVWLNGISDVAVTTVNSLVNLGINEFNYFLGWLIPPLPPLPPLATPSTETSDPVAADDGTVTRDVADDVGAEPEVATEEAVTDDSAATEDDVTAEDKVVNEDDVVSDNFVNEDAVTAEDKVVSEDVVNEDVVEAEPDDATDTVDEKTDTVDETDASDTAETPDHEATPAPKTETDTDGGDSAAQ